MNDFALQGLGIALVTPYNNNLEVDYDALGRLVDRDIAAGADYLVVLGTTGEAATLSAIERDEVRRFVCRRAGGRIPLVLGLGGNCTAAVIAEIRNTDISSFAAILSVTPFYNKPSQQGLFEHYSAIASASPVPVVLYNVPGRTGVNLSADTTVRLSLAHSNIIGVKEASGNITQVETILRKCAPGFKVVSGDDALAFPYICMGASGVISVTGNAYPRSYGALVHAAMRGDIGAARVAQSRFDPLFSLLFADGNPAGIKCLLAKKGLIANRLRLPLTPCTPAIEEGISRLVPTLADD